MSGLTDQLRHLAQDASADLIGVAPAKRLKDLPASQKLLAIFPR